MSSRELNHSLAVINARQLKEVAEEIQLDDPVRLLRTLSSIHGAMVGLRAYAKRLLAERAERAEQGEPGEQLAQDRR